MLKKAFRQPFDDLIIIEPACGRLFLSPSFPAPHRPEHASGKDSDTALHMDKTILKKSFLRAVTGCSSCQGTVIRIRNLHFKCKIGGSNPHVLHRADFARKLYWKYLQDSRCGKRFVINYFHMEDNMKKKKSKLPLIILIIVLIFAFSTMGGKGSKSKDSKEEQTAEAQAVEDEANEEAEKITEKKKKNAKEAEIRAEKAEKEKALQDPGQEEPEEDKEEEPETVEEAEDNSGESEQETDTEDSGKTEEETSEDTGSGDDTPVNGIRPSFKKAMDEYEEFFDSYVEFMEKYNSANPADSAAMLMDYTKYMKDYTEAMAALEKIQDDEDLSNEELVYYTEVMGRINTKLASSLQ